MTERRLRNRLKQARSEVGITQAELALKVQVSRKTINTIENEIFIPSTLLALLIASALGKPVEALFYVDEA